MPFLNSNLLGIGCHLLLGSKAILDATEERLELRVVGKDHDQNQYNGVDEHTVVRELAEQLGKHREQRRRDDGAAHIAQTAQDHEHQDENGRVEVELGGVGPNGAGKTTVFNLLTKVYQPTHGTILLDGEDTSGKSVYQVNRMGIARTFQNIRLFNTMTVEDNVKVGLHNQERYSGFEGVLRLPTYWKHEKAAHERAMELLSIFDMEHLANEQAGSLPYGAQRRLEIVRALATNPKLLLLDEPAAGMNPSETAELMENIVKIRDTFGIAIMLIEHDMSLVMNICEGICVLNFGKVIAKGTAEEIQNNDAVIEAYLGKQDKGEN